MRQLYTRGFTLMELLVATVLLSLVMTAVYTLIHSSVRTWRMIEENGDALRATRHAVILLENDVHRLAPELAHFMEGDEREAALFIYGSAMNVALREGKHLLRVRYYYDAPKKQLLRHESRLDYSTPQRTVRAADQQGIPFTLEDDTVFVIAENVTHVAFQYGWQPVVKQDPQSPPVAQPLYFSGQHQPGWGLPQALRIHMTMESDGKPASVEVTRTLPLRASTYRMPLEGLQAREAGAL